MKWHSYGHGKKSNRKSFGVGSWGDLRGKDLWGPLREEPVRTFEGRTCEDLFQKAVHTCFRFHPSSLPIRYHYVLCITNTGCTLNRAPFLYLSKMYAHYTVNVGVTEKRRDIFPPFFGSILCRHAKNTAFLGNYGHIDFPRAVLAGNKKVYQTYRIVSMRHMSMDEYSAGEKNRNLHFHVSSECQGR